MKIVKGVLALVIALLLQWSAEAQDFTYAISNGSITITEYIGPGGNVVIPSTISGLPVTAIGDFAFVNRSKLTTITIPSGITSIGMDAFAGCIALTSVTIPDTVSKLGEAMLASCDGLISVTIGNGITSIEANDFAQCRSLASVVMGNGVRSINAAAFALCLSLTNVVLPNTLTNIGAGAFAFCSLTNVALPDGLLSIGGLVFANCTNLTSIIIPKSVTNIGLGAFNSCISLAAIGVDTLNPMYSSVDGILFNKTQTELIRYPPARAGRYWVPSGVTIWQFAFDNYGGLTGALSARLAPNNAFGFTISQPTNSSIVIETTPNLISPIRWSGLSTNTLSTGLMQFFDPQWTNYPDRFYRIRPL
jgi:hypothetical protein